METKTTQVLGQLIGALWRRRVLLLTPLLVMLPLSLLGAKYLPKTYVASALMVMQESNRDNPFLKNSDVDITLVKRVEGLEAWLKSEHVMSQIVKKYSKTDPSEEPAAFMYELEEMRKAFSLKLVGNDFLKFQLKDSKAQGLGDKLGSITSRFLEGLLVPDRSVESATQVVLKSQKRKLQEMERRQQQLQAHYERKLTELRRLRKQVNRGALLKKMDYAPELDVPQNQIFPIGFQDRQDHTSDPIFDGATLMTLDNQTAGFEQREREKSRPFFELAQSRGTQELVRDRTTELSAIKQELTLLNEQVRIAQNNYQISASKLEGVNAQNALGILNAPEGIKIIDPPKDPVRPSTSALKIILAGLVSAVFLGMGLASIAEILDQRINSPEQIAELSGMPITGRLPLIELASSHSSRGSPGPDIQPG